MRLTVSLGLESSLEIRRENLWLLQVLKYPFFGDIEFVEASAILEDIKLAEELGLIPLVVESDSLNVIRLVSKRISSNLEID